MPELTYYSTDGKWCNYTLKGGTLIGRAPETDLQLLDRLISKNHARIDLNADGQYVLTDVGSRNGTTVNGKLVQGPVVLQAGDEIGMGNHLLRFVGDKRQNPATKLSQRLDDEDESGEKTTRNELPTSGEMSAGPSHSIRQPISDTRFLPENKIESVDDLRRDYEKLRVAAELAQEAIVVFDLDKLLGIILDKAFQIFNADRGAILLRDERTNQMTVRVAMSRDKKPIDNYKISETLFDEVISEQSAVLSRDALRDCRFIGSQSIVLDNVRSTMCVPLIYDDKVEGVINLDTQLITGAFKEKDLQILTGFARQAAMNIQRNRMIENANRQAIVQENLKRIIPAHLIHDVLSGRIKLEKSGTRRVATVLFADIRGFTSMTEQSSPETIVHLINDYCEKMVECIFKHEGALDKFVGDEVMAVWGTGVTCDDHAQKAIECAIDMMTAIEELNEQRQKLKENTIQIGIGIATGLMIAGYMGSTQAMSYTVIGDTVNLGARLCGAAQPGEILINKDAWLAVHEKTPCITLPPMMVKGKQAPIDIYRVKTNQEPLESSFDVYCSSVLSAVSLAKEDAKA